MRHGATPSCALSPLHPNSDEGALWQIVAKGFDRDAKMIVKMCRTAKTKMMRDGDYGLEPRSSFLRLRLMRWGCRRWNGNAAGESYLTFKIMNESRVSPQKWADRSSTRKNRRARKWLAGWNRHSDPFINTLGDNLTAAADGLWDGISWLPMAA